MNRYGTRAVLILSAGLVLSLAACQQSAQESASGTPDAADVVAVDTQPADATSETGSATDLPVMKPAVNDATMPVAAALVPVGVGASGYGALRFGMTRSEAEKAIEGSFNGSAEAGCQQARRAGQADVSYLFNDGRLQRIDVKTSTVIADGGGHVGMQADEIRTLYAGKLTEQPHKYVHGGLYLKAVDKHGAGIVFETDANGIVTSFRAGVEPTLDQVEGCS
ncbi:MAG: lectin [Lysobacteraceae bacterium]